MTFESDLSPATQERIRAKLRAGMPLWRGENTYANGSHKPADPGDHGAGTYYTTSFFRARCHGQPKQHVVRLSNPFVATDEAAYDQIEGRFDTLHAKDREAASRRATLAMQAAGYDGVVSINERRWTKPPHSEWEVVVFPLSSGA
jgi:hypothetical protein